jgi:hypothetical protein
MPVLVAGGLLVILCLKAIFVSSILSIHKSKNPSSHYLNCSELCFLDHIVCALGHNVQYALWKQSCVICKPSAYFFLSVWRTLLWIHYSSWGYGLLLLLFDNLMILYINCCYTGWFRRSYRHLWSSFLKTFWAKSVI